MNLSRIFCLLILSFFSWHARSSCSICLKNKDKSFRTLRCGHCFHEDCIEKWFENHETCPLCRSKKHHSKRQVNNLLYQSLSSLDDGYDIFYDTKYIIHTLVKNNNLKALKVALNMGFNVNSLNEEFFSPLHIAAILSRTDALALLQQAKGFDPHTKSKKDIQAIHLAAGLGNIKFLQQLLMYGIFDIDEKDAIGRTALYFASYGEHIKMINYLIKTLGASPFELMNSGESLVSLLIQHSKVLSINHLLALEENLLDLLSKKNLQKILRIEGLVQSSKAKVLNKFKNLNF